MKWFLRRGAPPIERLLLVESGPRADAERVVPFLRSAICGDAPIDLFTCLPSEPSGLGESSRAWRSYDASSNSERWQMLLSLRKQRHTAAAILCGESPLLAGWKLVLTILLPAKILFIDETEGSFWLDREHWRKAWRLGVLRSGIRSPETAHRLMQAAAFPFHLCLLLGFAAKVHIGRAMRATGPPEEADSDH